MKVQKKAVQQGKSKSEGRSAPSHIEGSAGWITGSPSHRTAPLSFTSVSFESTDTARARILKRTIVLIEAAELIAIQLGEHDAAAVEEVMSAIYGTRDICQHLLSSPSPVTEASKANAGQRTTRAPHSVELVTEGYDQTAKCVCGAPEGGLHFRLCPAALEAAS